MYFNGKEGFLAIKKTDIRIYINFYSKSIDEMSRHSLTFDYVAFLKDGKIVNSQTNIKEGSNEIIAFYHQVDLSSQYEKETSFLNVTTRSYIDLVGTRFEKDYGKETLDLNHIIDGLSEMSTETLETDIDSLALLIFEPLVKLQYLCNNKLSDEEEEKLFKYYQDLVNKTMFPIRKKVYEKKKSYTKNK